MSRINRGRVAVLFNPAAGKGRAIKTRRQLERLLDRNEIPHDFYISQSVQDLRELTRLASRRYRTLVGVGGDSTFQIIVDEVMKTGSHPALGLIGLGSSNDIAREFKVESLTKACSVLRQRRTTSIDLGCFTREGGPPVYFLGQANIGLGAFVNRYIEQLAERSPRISRRQTISGLCGIISAYRSGKIPVHLMIESNEENIDGMFIAAVFSNIRYWATGKLINPGAQVDDGCLNACLIRECSLPRLILLAILANKGRHVAAREVVSLRSPIFTVRSETGFAIQADGEIVGGWRTPALTTEIQVRVIPRALKLIC